MIRPRICIFFCLDLDINIILDIHILLFLSCFSTTNTIIIQDNKP